MSELKKIQDFNKWLREKEKELLPCPICGAPARFTTRSGGSGNYGCFTTCVVQCSNNESYIYDKKTKTGGFNQECCGVSMEGEDISWLCNEISAKRYLNLLKRWNRRK